MIAIIPCGGKKRPNSCRAGLMYSGSYHRACQDYALSLVPEERVLILSAKYGLLGLHERIDPYDVRMGSKDAISVDEVREQAQERGLLGEDIVIALGGKDYVSVMEAVWPEACLAPLQDVEGGIGKQLQWLKENTPTLFRRG